MDAQRSIQRVRRFLQDDGLDVKLLWARALERQRHAFAMLHDARRKQFDAIALCKFDRLARNRSGC